MCSISTLMTLRPSAGDASVSRDVHLGPRGLPDKLRLLGKSLKENPALPDPRKIKTFGFSLIA